MYTIEEKFAEYYPFLQEIGKKLKSVGIFFLIFFIIGFFSTTRIFRFVSTYFAIKDVTVITVSPFQFVDLAMNTGITIALVFTFPLLVYQIYSFLKNGLNYKEKARFIMYVPVIVLLFIMGFFYGFFSLYSTFAAIAQINIKVGMHNYWDISKLISEICITSALLGIIFEFPLVLSTLIRMNLFDIRHLKARRRHAIAIIFIGTSLLPPTDGVSLLVMVLPLVLLYEMTIFFNRKQQIII